MGATSPEAAWKSLHFDLEDTSFFRYRSWLPVHRSFAKASLPGLLRSEAIAQKFGLKDLDILFSGYDPELGSDIRSLTFKEFEAHSVFAYVRDCCAEGRILVVASAGNTARAFAEVALRENLAVLLVVPDVSLRDMQLSLPIKEDSKVVFVAGTHKYDGKPSEYEEAIAIAKILSDSPHFFPEGGVRNIARRDGLGVGYLHAQYSRYLRRPDVAPYRYYFQAIGSGTGAIGSYSMYKRLKRAGCIPEGHQFSLMLGQNAPFIPVVEHWREKRSDFRPYETQESLERNGQILAPVLGNRNPPYAITGGLADLLRECDGDAFAIENTEVAEMQELFAAEAGLDLVPAAAVAAGALRRAASEGRIDREAPVLLHLTGGGQNKLDRDFPKRYSVRAARTVDLTDLQRFPEQQRELIRDIERLFHF
ncbi:pyridoxal-phosphate dependent enzyme [Candidatus Haliotispira prima]|uniref:Pyridoxal-phosphate dependent enzyme n=1 Tax=Candidatus Haliotispira prima TaxID=3034016 RepID=A0ABY8MHH4_9SPIO|nr:pyridoxal-phosphate dependent enzyme [Candidatus Haliotispira prima]